MNDDSPGPATTPPPGPEPATWQSTGTPVPAPGEGPPTTPGWKVADAGSSGRRSRALVVGLAVVATVVVIGFIGLVFLGGQVAKILAGTIEYGTGGTGCAVTGNATTFPTSATVHFAAHLTHEVPAGTKVTQMATLPDGKTETQDQAFDTPGQCLYGDLGPALPPGHYVVELRVGTETLSKGAFDITP